MKWVRIQLMERWILGSGRCLFSNWSQPCTHNPTTHTHAHTHTHTHTHIPSSPDTQNTHLTLKRCRLTAKTHSTDRSNLIYNACVPCVSVGVRVCHSVRQRRAEGVRGQNCKFESVTYRVIYLSSATTLFSPHTHTYTHTHTVSTRAPPSHSFQS